MLDIFLSAFLKLCPIDLFSCIFTFIQFNGLFDIPETFSLTHRSTRYVLFRTHVFGYFHIIDNNRFLCFHGGWTAHSTWFYLFIFYICWGLLYGPEYGLSCWMFHKKLKWVLFSSSLECSININKYSIHINWILFSWWLCWVLTHFCWFSV